MLYFQPFFAINSRNSLFMQGKLTSIGNNFRRIEDRTVMFAYNRGFRPWRIQSSPTRKLARNLYAFDQWCLRRILGISWRNRISNEEVRRRTDQPPLTDTIRTTRFKYFGHIACADPSMDHSRALRASVAPCQGTGNVEPADRVTPGFRPRV